MAALHVWMVVVVGCLLHVSSSTEGGTNLSLRKHRERRAINVTLRVTSITEAPFLTLRKLPVEGVVQDRFEGFIVDLLESISRKTGITFNIHHVADSRYGAIDDSSDVGWNGMIGEVIRGENDTSGSNAADLAAAPLIVTSARRRAVRFIHPFQHIGLTLLAKKQSSESTDTLTVVSGFRILAPMAPSVWCLCLVAFLVVSILLWGMIRLNPYEWRYRYNLGQATEEQAVSFTLAGSIWFTFTTLQWQGYERGPRSIGSRLLAGFWFMFVTLSLVTYTASLVNNLFWASAVHGKDPRDLPFRDLEELLMHPEYKIGVVTGGSTYTYLKRAPGPEFDLLRTYLDSEEGIANRVTGTSKGVRRISSDEKFVFITNSGTAKFLAARQPCDLITVGPNFGKRAYGMAIRKNLPRFLVDSLDLAILQLMEEGDIEALEDRWFGLGECWNVTRREKLSGRNTLFLNKPRTVDLSMFWGPLVLLLVGIIIALATSMGEVLFHRYRGQYDPNNRPVGQKLSLDEDNI